MKQVHIHGKVFDDTDFKNLVIGGQNNADTIQFVLPKIYGNEIDFSSSDWIFTITYVNKEGEGDAVVLTKSDSSKSENIYLDWKPSQTATQVEGKLTCQLSGTKKNADADDVSRFTTKPFAIYVDKYLSPEPITQSLPSVIEQALEMMAEYNADVQHAIQIGEAAEENANAAAGSASDAASSASEAESSKVAAAGSALDAADSASEANDSKVAAAGSASDAADSASDANESKIAAAGSASDAADSASEANDSKVAAAGSASDAAGSASEANDSKVAAAGSASDAAGSASEANDSKVAAAGSASEAEFFAKISERYAKGTEDGVAVSSGDGYQDNSKYYKDQCNVIVESGKSDINSLATSKKSEIETLASQKTSSFDAHVNSKQTAFDSTVDEAVTQVTELVSQAESAKTLAEAAKAGAEAARDETEVLRDISGAASTIISSNLTANRVLVSDGTGKVAISGITTTLLNYLSGLTGNVQTQINSKLNSSALTLKDASYSAL